MGKILLRIGHQIYHAVHTNGPVADTVYWIAFYGLDWWRRLQYRWIKAHAVPAEELQRYSHSNLCACLATAVTNICNAKCCFCAYPRAVANKSLEPGIMPFEIFKRAVDEWAALGGQNLDLSPVVGDPLVDPGLMEKVDYAVNRVRLNNVVLTTNGILLNRNHAYKNLIDLGITAVCISTEGTDSKTYEKVYGVKHYEEVISGIRNLLEYNRMRGEPARIVIRFRNAERPSQIVRSKDFAENIRPYLSERVRINFTVDYDNWGGTIRQADLIGCMRLRTLPPTIHLPCKYLFNLSVRFDGSVRLCGCRFIRTDFDDLVVGNIREQPLKQISDSERTWSIIKGFYSGTRPETCVSCTMYRPIERRWLERSVRK